MILYIDSVVEMDGYPFSCMITSDSERIMVGILEYRKESQTWFFSTADGIRLGEYATKWVKNNLTWLNQNYPNG